MEILCPSCKRFNRIPDERLGDGPKCGACKAPLLGGTVANLDDGNLRQAVSRHGLPLLLDFWADWCGPCKMMAPVFSQVAKELAGQVSFAKVDTMQAPAASGSFGIRSIPTLILFKDGQELARVSGALQASQLKTWLAQQLR
ncbi:thioredoxin TrxC [Gallaecimonas kandeliae]|uniref:thioredoxin TrxC n=1 Tax=Gallaecimonas kandeliae TaxID=3029055 RepID=UPI002648FB5D|nr:thioredoxin TrxC [Gallaecimonas kandeliae]WKE66096.1 thioredoxin TrxC [Gallaecimonas kandeliae]